MAKRGPKDWTPTDATRKKLRTRAKDNHGHQYDVWLEFHPSEVMGWKWVLRIDGTPGHWYMSTLLEGGYPRGNLASIDYGQNWNVTNFGEVLEEAVDLI